MSSTSCFNLDQSKNLLSSTELKCYLRDQTRPKAVGGKILQASADK